jgi:3-oxoacyl-[acyl-carrier protein] reductase
MVDERLIGKVAIVTGAGRGLGRAIAAGYARAGAAVVCVARSQDQIDETVRTISASGGKAIAIAADVTEPSAVEAMVARAVQAFGGLDILFLNAGVLLDRATVEDSDPVAWSRTIQTNLVGAYLCARAGIPHLRARGGGKIITMGSGLGHRGRAGNSSYACSKAGLWMLTRVLAQELAEYNISVNELIPGPVETAMNPNAVARWRARGYDSEWIKYPDDVVPLALFLAAQPLVGPSAQSYSLMRRDT